MKPLTWMEATLGRSLDPAQAGWRQGLRQGGRLSRPTQLDFSAGLQG